MIHGVQRLLCDVVRALTALDSAFVHNEGFHPGEPFFKP